MEIPEDLVALFNSEEDVVSGAHIPAQESLWSVPNDAPQEEPLEKTALGLTSIPAAINGGTPLNYQGVPENPGLSREMGDDEETDFFGAPGDDSFIDVPPKNQKYQDQESVKAAINNVVARYRSFDKMNRELNKLFKNLTAQKLLAEAEVIRKLAVEAIPVSQQTALAKEVANKIFVSNGLGGSWLDAVNSKLTDQALFNNQIDLQWIIGWAAAALIWREMIRAGFPKQGIHGEQLTTNATLNPSFQSWENFSKTLAQTVGVPVWSFDSEPGVAIRNMLSADEMTGGEIKSTVDGTDFYGIVSTGDLDLAAIGNMFEGAFSTAPAATPAPAPQETPSTSVARPAPTSAIHSAPHHLASTWEEYVSLKGPQGEAVQDAWMLSHPETPAYGAWVDWYKQEAKQKGSALSPEEVVAKLKPAEVPVETVSETPAPTSESPPSPVPESTPPETPPIASGATPTEQEIKTQGFTSPEEFVAAMSGERIGPGKVVAYLSVDESPSGRAIILVEWEGETDPERRYDSLAQREDGKFYDERLSRREMRALRQIYRAPRGSTTHLERKPTRKPVRKELRRERRERRRASIISDLHKIAKS